MPVNSNNYFSSKTGVYIIAEIGGNHEGRFEYAERLTRLAAESGVNAVKFQIYSADFLVNPVLSPERSLHFKKFGLSKEEYIKLAQLCKKLNVTFMASVWDAAAIEYIDRYISIYKIGSGDLTAYNLIKKIAATGKPIILSTGLSTIEEVLETVNFITGLDGSYTSERKLALLQCTSMYPMPEDEANLNVMIVLKEKFGLPVGYSDHALGTYVAELAVAMGAEIIEAHFTESRENKIFRDHEISFTKEEMQNLIKKAGRIISLQGSFDKKPTQSELRENHIASFRRAVYPRKDLKAGAVITEEDLIILRPNTGLDSREFYNIIGKRLKIDVEKYQKLSLDLFE